MQRTTFSFAATAAALATAFVLTACGGDNPDTMLASARDYAAKNDYKAAVIQLKNALQKQPDSPEARYLLGLSLLRTGDAQAAEIELRKARDLKHSEEQVVPILAQALAQQGKAKQLITDFASTRLGTPAANAELQVALAQAYEAERNAKASQEALQAALAAQPDNSAAALMQIRQKLGAGDVEGGARQLEAVLAKDPRNPEAWKLKGDLMFYARRALDEAAVAYRKSLDIKPDFLPGHFGLVATLYAQNKLDDAEKELAALKKIAASHPQTRYLDTQYAFLRRDYPKARDLAQQLLKVAPGYPRALELAGGIDLQMGSLVTAEEHLGRAVQAAPELPLARRWLATVQLRRGQADRALATLAPVLNDKTSDPQLLALAGQAELQAGNPAKAEAYFAKASKLDPADARKQTTLALARMAGGKVEAGFEQLEDIATADKGTTADLALISAHLRRRELDKALKAIDALEKKTPGTPVAPNLRGRTLLAKGDMTGARKAFEAALQAAPKYLPAIASLAALDVADKKPEIARKRFEDVLANDPKNAGALLALADLRAREGGDKKEVAALITKAIEANPNESTPRVLLVDYHLRQRDAKLALAAAQNALAAMPDRPELLDVAGRAQLAAGESQQAITTFSKLVSLQPQSPQALLRLADAQMVAKNPSAAEQALKKALELRPDVLETYQRLLAVYGQQNRYDDMLALARTAQKRYPKNGMGYAMEGEVLAAQKKFAEAASVFQAGYKVAPVAEMLIRTHGALLGAGKGAEADRLAAMWLKDKPQDLAVPMYLADVALRRNELATAERYYLMVVKTGTEGRQQATAYNNLAWVTSQLKKDGALAYAEKANTLAPDQPAFMDTLAVLLADKQDYRKAIELQAKVLGMQGGDNPLYKLNMARIYIKAGEKDSARKQLDELAKLGEKFSGQAEVEKLRATL